MLAAGMLTAASCSDFSDYNEVPVSLQPSGEKTLWENINENPQLSQFASLLSRTGISAQLSQPRAYTIWAPLNNTFDYAGYQQMSDSMLTARFAKNHIAEYYYLATGDIDEENRVHMLNNKSYVFTGNGNYQFDGNDIVQANLPSMNGVMHLMSGAAQFYPNLYEFLSIGDGLDSLNSYFKRYEVTTLDLTESEKGPIVDGMQTYVDSVMVTENTLLTSSNGVRANIESEDSSYTFLMPNNEGYKKMYDKVKPLFNFISKTKVQDAENLSSAGGTTASADATRNKTYKEAPAINVSYMADSLVRRIIVRNLIYSNNEGYYNEKIRKGDFDNLDEQTKDTVYSTTRHKLTNAKELFDEHLVGQPMKMSNGVARIVDSLAFFPWETYNPEIVSTPLRDRAKLFSANTTNVTRYFVNPVQFMGMRYPATEIEYLLMVPNTTSGKPDLFLKLPNVHSGTYKFYCVVLPPLSGQDMRSTPMNFDLSYCDTKGALQNWHFSSNPDDKNPTLSMNTAFINDTTKVDTLELGEFTFPVNYDGLGEDYYPSLYISSPVSTSSLRKTWSREFRILAVILKPVELVEYEENNK